MLQAHWQEGGWCWGSPWKCLHHPLQHPHLQARQEGWKYKKGRNDFSDQVGHPDCVSEPVKQCENIPNSNKRNVARTVCDTVVDTHEVEVGFQLKLILMLILTPILLMMLIPMLMLMLIGMLMMMLMQDCTETITEVCEQTNTYSHTTVSFKSTISQNCNLQ